MLLCKLFEMLSIMKQTTYKNGIIMGYYMAIIVIFIPYLPIFKAVLPSYRQKRAKINAFVPWEKQ